MICHQLQRCWVHILRDAEEYAMKNDEDLVQYRRLLALQFNQEKRVNRFGRMS